MLAKGVEFCAFYFRFEIPRASPLKQGFTAKKVGVFSKNAHERACAHAHVFCVVHEALKTVDFRPKGEN